MPTQGHRGQEGVGPRLLNPSPRSSPLSVMWSKATAQITTHSGFTLSDLVGGFLVARNRDHQGRLKLGGCCLAAEEGLPEAGMERKAFEACGDERLLLRELGMSSIPQRALCRKSGCPSVSASAATLRTPHPHLGRT